MIILNPDKLDNIFNQPWIKLHEFQSTVELVKFSLSVASTNQINGYIELQCRLFDADNVYQGLLVGSYDRLYRLADNELYLYQIKPILGLKTELWVRFKSNVHYRTDISLNVESVELLGEPLTSEGDSEMISILRLDSNWEFNVAGATSHAYLRSFRGGEFAIGSCEFGFYKPLPVHTRLWLPMMGGLIHDGHLKLIEFVAENNTVLASYNATQLLGNPLVNDSHTPYRYHLPLHASKERFKVRLTDSDNSGEQGWSWFGVYPEGLLVIRLIIHNRSP